MHKKTFLLVLSLSSFSYLISSGERELQQQIKVAVSQNETDQVKSLLAKYDQLGGADKRNAEDFMWLNEKGSELLKCSIKTNNQALLRVLLQYGATVDESMVKYARHRVNKRNFSMILDAAENQDAIRHYYDELSGMKPTDGKRKSR